MADQSLEILIKTIADTAGLTLTEKQISLVKDQMESLAGKTKDLNKEMGVHVATQDEVRRALNESKQPLEENEKATEKAHMSHRAMHMLMRELGGHSIPGMSEAVMGLTNHTLGILGPVIAIAAAWHIWEARVKACNEALGAVALPDLTKGLDTIQNQATSWEGLSKAIRSASEEYNGYSAAHERALAAITAEEAAIKKLMSAKEKEREQQIDLAVSTGEITAAEGAIKKRIVKEGISAETTKLEEEARNAKVESMRLEAAEAAKTAKEKAAKAEGIKGLGGANADEKVSEELIKQQEAIANNARESAEKQRHAGYIAANAPTAGISQTIDPFAEGGAEALMIFGAGATRKSLNAQAKSLFSGAAGQFKIAAEAEKKVAAMKKALEERKRLRAEAEKAQKDADDLALKVAFEDEAAAAVADAEKTGKPVPAKYASSVAVQNMVDKQALGYEQRGSKESGFAADINTVKSDVEKGVKLNTENHTPENRAAAMKNLKDANDALHDAALLMAELARMGISTKDMQRQLAELRLQVAHLNTRQ